MSASNPFDFFRSSIPAFGSFPGMPGMGGNPGVPPVDFARMLQTGAIPSNLEELSRRIEELKTVEQWLSFNLQVLRTTIQGMEVQQGTLTALKSMQESFGFRAGPSTSSGSADSAGPSAGPEGRNPEGNNPAGAAQNPSEHIAEGMNRATEAGQAWWNTVQQQFNQMASAAQAFHSATGGADSAASGEPGGANEKRSGTAKTTRGTRPRKPPAKSKLD